MKVLIIERNFEDSLLFNNCIGNYVCYESYFDNSNLIHKCDDCLPDEAIIISLLNNRKWTKFEKLIWANLKVFNYREKLWRYSYRLIIGLEIVCYEFYFDNSNLIHKCDDCLPDEAIIIVE